MPELADKLVQIERISRAATLAGLARNMTMTQFAILAHINKETPIPLKEVAESLRVKKPLVSRAMDRFEEQGLAKRYDDPRDRRSVQLGLTYRGRMFLQRVARNIENNANSDGDGRVDGELVPEDPA